MEASERLNQLRLLKLEKGRIDFWEFCKGVAPDFYKEGRWHLKKLARVMQAFFENRIVANDEGEWEITDRMVLGGKVCKQLYIEMPPRHGKTRTLTLFCAWALGKDERTRFMYTSYNDDVASDTSRFVRDIIAKDKVVLEEFVYSDYFSAKLQMDNKAVSKWALEGQYFNFVSSGKGGSVTGKGCNVLIVDDPVKSAKEALNEREGDDTWKWFTDTLLSRNEEGGKIIVNHTRWPRRDLIERLKGKYKDKKSKPYYELVFPAMDEETGEMLCEELLSKESFEDRMALTDPEIFQANYQQKVLALSGGLYKVFNTYRRAPADVSDCMVHAWCDYADMGKDSTASICGWIRETSHGAQLIVKDIFFVSDAVEEYRDAYVRWLAKNDVDILTVESNNGGRGFALYLEETILEEGGKTMVDWRANSTQKLTRILTHAPIVQTMIVFPEDWKERWREFYLEMVMYKRVGKNEHDDAPDVCTMAAEDLGDGGLSIYG